MPESLLSPSAKIILFANLPCAVFGPKRTYLEMYAMSQLTLFDNSDSSQSTSSAEDSHAPTSPLPEKAQVSALKKRRPAAAYGMKWHELLAKSDPLGYSLRTYLRSACEALTGFSLIWRLSDTPAKRLWWVLGRSEHRTSGIEFGSWPTVDKSCGDRGGAMLTGDRPSGQSRQVSINDAVKQNCAPPPVTKDWQTPSAQQFEKRRQVGQTERNELLLLGQARRWPTPKAQNDKASGPSRIGCRVDLQTIAGQPDPASPSTTGKPRGLLNSAWVAQLMGWPENYFAELESAMTEYHLSSLADKYAKRSKATQTRRLCEPLATHGSTPSPG